jgi:protein O-GlcNAc transferase
MGASGVLGSVIGRLMAQVAGRNTAPTPPEFTLFLPADALERLDEVDRDGVGRALLAHNLGKYGESAALLRSALKNSPENSDLLALLGMSELEAGNDPEARRLMAEAKRLQPAIARRFHDSGVELYGLGHRERALACFLLASQLDQTQAAHFAAVGDVLVQLGREAEARAWFEQSVKLEARPAYMLKCVLSGLRAVYGSAEEMHEARERYERELAQLDSLDLRIDHPEGEVSYLPFYLAYMGLNDRLVQQRLAKIYLKACPALAFVAPHCGRGYARRPGPLRVGFASAFFRSHSVGFYYNALIRRLLERSELDVHVIGFGEALEPALLELAAPRSRYLELWKKDLAECRTKIAELELDVLLYADIGMHPISYFLAFARLAPTQICMAGHPVTTGLPSVDDYLSSELLERDDADAHYSERLLRLRCLPLVMRRPSAPRALLDRATLGVSQDRPLFVCPMKLQKIHPDFDRAIAEILRREPRAELVMFQDHDSPAWDLQVKKRFAKAFPDVLERVNFLPWANHDEFYSILSHADAALDTFHFGGGVTAMWVLAAGCPFVTLPGRMLAGRGVLAFYRKMGVMDCVASDFEDYVAKVLRLGRDREFRAAVRARILERNDAIFMNYDVADELTELLPRLAAERAAP